MCTGSSEDEFITASEGEEETTPTNNIVINKDATPPVAAVKVFLSFTLPHLSVDINNSTIQCTLHSLNINGDIKTYTTQLYMSISSLQCTHYIKDTPINVLSTDSQEQLLNINILQVRICIFVYYITHTVYRLVRKVLISVHDIIQLDLL